MSGLLKRTATKLEIQSIQKRLAAGVPAVAVAREFGIREDCIENFAAKAPKKDGRSRTAAKEEF